MNIARAASYNELMAALVEAANRITELEAELALVRAELERATGRHQARRSVAGYLLSYGVHVTEDDTALVDEW